MTFKYALLGNQSFWNTSSDSIDQLRAVVEERIYGNPDDLVADAQAGPLTPKALRSYLQRDGKQVQAPVRLVSAAEEWASTRLQCEQSGEMVCAALMNISLDDPANWRYWVDTLELPHAYDGRPVDHPSWARLTCPISVPRAYLPSLQDPLLERQRAAMEAEAASTGLESVLISLVRGPMLVE